jgi:hypothetical protein
MFYRGPDSTQMPPVELLQGQKDPHFVPGKGVLAVFFQRFTQKQICKVMHNVIVRPTGPFVSECLDFHCGTMISTGRCVS